MKEIIEKDLETKDLIIVEQLPIITDQLQSLKVRIQKIVDEVKALVCTEDTKKTVKDKRAELNNKFKALEEKRKEVKNAVLEPYNRFEAIYKDNVSDLFKSADADLKKKVDDVEDAIKLEKEIEIKKYFEELKLSLGIDFIEFGKTGVKVGISNSMKSLKDSMREFLNKAKEDLELIETQENKSEILVEYKKSLCVSQAITVVAERIKRIAEEKERQAEREKQREVQKATAEKVEKIVQAPTVEQPIEKLMTVTFKVTATRENLIELKKFLNNGGYDYE